MKFLARQEGVGRLSRGPCRIMLKKVGVVTDGWGPHFWVGPPLHDNPAKT
jgi:hypothetical protein